MAIVYGFIGRIKSEGNSSNVTGNVMVADLDNKLSDFQKAVSNAESNEYLKR
jgi:hypothetical protein